MSRPGESGNFFEKVRSASVQRLTEAAQLVMMAFLSTGAFQVNTENLGYSIARELAGDEGPRIERFEQVPVQERPWNGDQVRIIEDAASHLRSGG